MSKQLFTLNFLVLLFICPVLFGQTAYRPDDGLVKRILQQTAEKQLLTGDDLLYEITDYYTGRKTGAQHIFLRQSFNGLEISGTESAIHIDAAGKTLSVHNRFLNSLTKRGHGTTVQPQLTAIQVVEAVAEQMGYGTPVNLQLVEQMFTVNQKTLMTTGGISLENIPAELKYYLKEDGNLALVWVLSIRALNQTEYYNVYADAHTGEILHKVNWMHANEFEFTPTETQQTNGHSHQNEFQLKSASSNTGTLVLPGAYNVFPIPVESPYYGDRELVYADDIVNLNASPFGWHDTNGVNGAEYTVTRGNNVNAYEDGNNYGFQPDGGDDLIFDFPFDQNYTNQNQYEAAAVTNLFYMNNIIHDVFYEYGFDEVSGNFQQNNYGNGGLGNDYVLAEAQDNSGTCNANFATPPDGQNPIMQMYICGNKDGDYDNVVIAHEYGHGISIRMTGGPSNSDCLWNSEQMGEGWSDWFGLMLTIKEGDTGEMPRGIANYLFGYGPNGGGIRTYPYSTDMSINPHTYDSIKTEYPPHGVGSVWAAMLWDLTWKLIDEYGFDPDIYNGTGGNNIALALVVEGLRLQPCSPGFVDGRDAILMADQLLFNGENTCLIWDVFARRGLGYSATQGSSNNQYDGQEAFDSPSGLAEFTGFGEVCTEIGVMTGLSGGMPFGGVYSGPGVTDNGNGMTYDFDSVAAGIGIHTITYTVEETACAPGSSSSDQIEVTPGLVVSGCPADVAMTLPEGECTAVISFDTPTGTSGCIPAGIQNFDNVALPNLPAGWTTITQSGAANNWITVSNVNSSAPNSAYAGEPTSPSLSDIISPEYTIGSNNPKLKFDIYLSTEMTYDGVVLEYTTEYEIDNWNDIMNGGAVSMSLPYNGPISTGWSNPLGGRNAWFGNTNGFVTVEVLLNPDLSGENIRFRWRMGTDYGGFGNGVWLDNVVVEGILDEGPVTTQIEGLPSGSEFPSGTTTNVFEIVDGAGNTTICSFDVVLTDNISPEIICPENTTVLVGIGESYILPDYWTDGVVSASDNCLLGELTQSPEAGTALPLGTHTISFTAADASGNTVNCSFTLKVDETMSVADMDFENLISVYPNPTDGKTVIHNPDQQHIESVKILDTSGKLLREFKLNNSQKENQISLENYPSGTYLLQIKGAKQTIVKKLIKK
ncbi:MAG: M36 family metallopeptidase [Weeksellaceae bacterium]